MCGGKYSTRMTCGTESLVGLRNRDASIVISLKSGYEEVMSERELLNSLEKIGFKFKKILSLTNTDSLILVRGKK